MVEFRISAYVVLIIILGVCVYLLLSDCDFAD